MQTNGLEVPSAGDVEQMAMDSLHELSKSGTMKRYAYKANTLAHDCLKSCEGERADAAREMRNWCEENAGVESFLLLFVVDHLADEIENGGTDD